MDIQDRTHFNHYEHVPTRTIWAIRWEQRQVTGCLGPYRLDQARQTDVTRLDYDAERRWVAWARREMAAGNFELTG